MLDRNRREVRAHLCRAFPGTGWPAGWNQREGRRVAVRRYRFAGSGLEADQTGMHADIRALSQFPIYEQGIRGEGQTACKTVVELRTSCESLPCSIRRDSTAHHGQYSARYTRDSLPAI